MSLDNPTGVNPFNGMSDDHRSAAHFESLWQAGAFDSENPREAEQLRQERAEANPQPPKGQQPPKQTQQAAPQATEQVEQQPPEQQTQEAAEPPTAEQEEGPEYRDLDDYLTQSKIDRDSFMAMPVTVKVDGKTSQVTMQDLVRSYQTDAHVTQKSQGFAEKQREWEGQQQQAKQALIQTLQNTQALFGLAHQVLLKEYQGTDWNKLRAEDPINWTIKSQEFNQRAGEIQNFLARVQQATQEQTQQAEQQRLAELPKEWEKTLEQVPAWRDDKQFQADRGEMLTYGQKLGFSPAELSGIHDHRYMVALYQASQFAKLQAQAPQAVKKVRAAPQVANPGARITRDPNTVARNQAKERFYRNPRDQDAGAAYFETLA